MQGTEFSVWDVGRLRTYNFCLRGSRAFSPYSLSVASSCTSLLLPSAFLFQMAINRSALHSVGGRDEGGNVSKEEVTGRAVCREQPERGGGGSQSWERCE